MFHNTNRTKYNKKFKIQTRQNTKEQNTNTTKYKRTKYKCNKIQMGQNANRTKYKIPKYKHDKIQILGVPIENQCVKGGGLLYGGCILVFLHFVLFVFCHVVFCCICILLHLYFGNLYFVLLYFVVFVFWNFAFCSICILSTSVVFCSVCIMEHLYFDTDSIDNQLCLVRIS